MQSNPLGDLQNGSPKRQPPTLASPRSTTAVVLAGGRGSRLGGQDKGLITLHGHPLIAYILAALHQQVDTLLISANRNHTQYAQFGAPILPDHNAGRKDFLGPLAGIATALAFCRTEYLLTVPCDSPWPPATLLARLALALQQAKTTLAIAHDGQRIQPLFGLLHRSNLTTLQQRLQAGQYRVTDGYAQLGYTTVDFSDEPQAFININTAEQLTQAMSRTFPAPDLCAPTGTS